MAKSKRRKVRIVVRGLVKEAERKLKAKLRAGACSEPWVEAQIRYIEAFDKRGKRVMVAEWIKGVFPVLPGMTRCAGCERWYPAVYVKSRGYCEDCISEKAPAYWINAQPSSQTVVMMRELKARSIPR